MPQLSLQQRAFGRLALVVGLVCLLAGGLPAYLQGPPSVQGGAARPDAGSLLRETPHAHALDVIGRYRHWGDYREAAEDGPLTAGLDLATSFQMVGLEQRAGEQVALLLFIEGKGISVDSLVVKPDADNILRLRQGDALLEGVRVTGMSLSAVTLTGEAGGETIDPAQAPRSWTLSMYPADDEDKDK
jgi:hypothetical protein